MNRVSIICATLLICCGCTANRVALDTESIHSHEELRKDLKRDDHVELILTDGAELVAYIVAVQEDSLVISAGEVISNLDFSLTDPIGMDAMGCLSYDEIAGITKLSTGIHWEATIVTITVLFVSLTIWAPLKVPA
jgi:hypothetical protein